MKQNKRPPQPKHKQTAANKNITTFKAGNKAAEKWTEENVIPVLEEMLRILKTNPLTGEEPQNPCHANKIKLTKELCLLVELPTKTFTYWQRKFYKETKTVNEMFIDNNGIQRTRRKQVPNPYFSPAVLHLIAFIKDICEVRLVYSGTPMDIFLLKKHYGYSDNLTNTRSTQSNLDSISNTPVPTPMPIIVTVVQMV